MQLHIYASCQRQGFEHLLARDLPHNFNYLSLVLLVAPFTAKVAAARDILLAVAFDHEEVGSQSATGADGATLPNWSARAQKRFP
eukprot:6483314-Amphidinium_carterae.1